MTGFLQDIFDVAERNNGTLIYRPTETGRQIVGIDFQDPKTARGFADVADREDMWIYPITCHITVLGSSVAFDW